MYPERAPKFTNGSYEPDSGWFIIQGKYLQWPTYMCLLNFKTNFLRFQNVKEETKHKSEGDLRWLWSLKVISHITIWYSTCSFLLFTFHSACSLSCNIILCDDIFHSFDRTLVCDEQTRHRAIPYAVVHSKSLACLVPQYEFLLRGYRYDFGIYKIMSCRHASGLNAF